MGLIGVSRLISPQLLRVLSEMGHGDEIVFADIHFPTSSICANSKAIEIRADGHSIPALLHAVLPLFPLDTFEPSVALMQVVPGTDDKEPPIWKIYRSIVSKIAEPPTVRDQTLQQVERFAFYERVKSKAYAVVHTGDTAKYGNIILKKGLVNYD